MTMEMTSTLHRNSSGCGTGTGKTHLAIAIARSCIRSGSRGRFYKRGRSLNRLDRLPQPRLGLPIAPLGTASPWPLPAKPRF